MSEKEIENSILHFLNSFLGIKCWKNQSTGVFDPVKKIYRKSNNKHHIKGVSDILGIIQGRFLAIEVKSETGKLTPEQKAFILSINEEGGIAFVARSLQDVVTNLTKFFPENKNLRELAKRYNIPQKFTEQ